MLELIPPAEAKLSPEALLTWAKQEGVEEVDIRFTDIRGMVQHFSLPIQGIDHALFEEGFGFDGSSVRGFQSIDQSDLILFADLETLESVEPDFYAPDIDTSGLDQMGTIAGMKRFWAGPPGVPSDVLENQHEAFDQIVNDDEFTDEALEAQRPVVEPGDHTVVEDVIQESYDLLSSDPYKGILEEVLSG
jgi:hypothetical protein